MFRSKAKKSGDIDHWELGYIVKNMIHNKKIISGILALLLLGAGVVLGMMLKETTLRLKINSFDECVVAGYPVMESYPRQCKTSDGKIFVEQIEGGKFPQESPEDFTSAPAEDDVCRQAKYQEACEARQGCLWIGCPNNVCVSSR